MVEEAWQRAGDRRDPSAADKRHHRTPEEQFRYENHVRYMIPLDWQVGFLRAAGFEGVDVFWKELDFVIYGGRRPLDGYAPETWLTSAGPPRAYPPTSVPTINGNSMRWCGQPPVAWPPVAL